MPELVRDLLHEPVVAVGLRQQCPHGREHRAERQRRPPGALRGQRERVEADAPSAVDVGVEDGRGEAHARGFDGVASVFFVCLF